MAHVHPITDDDRLFIIDPTNRSITYEGDNIVLVKGDHNSEVFSFEIPRIVEGHDMSLCNHIRIHYSNTDRRRKNESKDIYYVTDCVVNGDVVNFSWTLSGNATKYYGTLSFLVQFCCLEEDGTYSYIWNTDTYKSIPVYDSYNNSEGVAENYADVFGKIFLQLEKVPDDMAQLRQELLESVNNLPQPDWNQNDGTAADFVKNRPFYTGDPVETVLVEERTVAFADTGYGFYGAEVVSTFEATVGETYKVSWDGTAYECTCTSFNDIPIIGNLSIRGTGSDTGEPFLIGIKDGEGIEIITADTSTSHTISISGMVIPVVKIDKKYLVQPDWNQNDEAAADYIKNKPLIATNDDAMDFLAEMGMIIPVTNSNGEILTSPSNEIYSL